MTNYCVYLHTSPTNKYYVGITKQNPLKRWANGRGYCKNKHFYNAILKYGWDNFKHEIIFSGITKTDAGKALNIDNSGISRVCREGESGKYKGKYKNFKWKYF